MKTAIISIFIQTAVEAFRFLPESHGFRLSETRVLGGEGAVIRYESERTYLEIWYDAMRGGELSVNFGLLDDQEIRVPFVHAYMAASSPALENCIRRLAEGVASEAQPYLRGDISAFQQYQQERSKKDTAWWEEDNLRRGRAGALEAWHRKDYARVIALYESMQAALSDAERKKLAYARKHGGE